MWSVALVSMTQSKFLKASLLTFLVKNIECDRLGLKGKLEEVPDMRLEQRLAEELTCDCEENTSKVPPECTSTQTTLEEALTLAAWCDPSPPEADPEPELRKANNCSHGALEIGHKLLVDAELSAPLHRCEET